MTARIPAPLAALLGAGLVLRLLFIAGSGFHNDVAAFESWTLTLRDNPPWQFFAKVTFSEYPPGYFVILWGVAKLDAMLGGGGGLLLRALVKLPAIVMDLINAWVVYSIARRYASQGVALAAAAALALNPVAIYVSAYWGQVDSVSWGFALIAVWCVLRAGDAPDKTIARLAWAWTALAFSILIKPPAAILVLLFLAYPFATSDAAVRARRLAGTAAGIGAALALAVAVGLLFHPSSNVIGWLFGRYAYGSGIYPFNSVNAFNLYALRQPFWQSDTVPLTIFGIHAGSLATWGVALVLAATALIVGRYLQRRDDRALLEGAMLCALAFFVLATRMHERYVYGAFLLAVPLIAFGRSGAWATLLLSVTTYLNLAYSLAYQTVMEAHTVGVDATDLWPWISHPAALANVALFFWLGYRYLGAPDLPEESSRKESVFSGLTVLARKARTWFDPREGLAGMTRRDWLFAGLFTLGSFVLCVVRLNFPAEKIFDEIYYARAGEEYLRHADVHGLWSFEFTHPPLTKLLITSSMLLFGGLHGLGDTAIGWRFGNVVVGALTVGLIYVFAKRLTASTLFASLAAMMLALDGFHYVQSRIATPEITVAFFSLLTLYAFYRLWVGTQIARRVPLRARAGAVAFGATMALGVVAAAGAWFVAPQLGPIRNGEDIVGAARAVLAVWVIVLFWLIGRVLVAPRFSGDIETSYPDGTRVLAVPPRIVTPNDDEIPLNARAKPSRTKDGDLLRTVGGDGTLTYATPVATATYRPDGTATVDDTPVRARDARVWWIALALSAALLADSKWNGLFDIAVVWAVAAAVGAQRWFRRPALFGNPFGAPVDVVAAAIVVAGGAVYMASYIPYFALGHGFVDVIGMQQQMYGYHAHLQATHPYASQWWQWPLLDKPILYYANYTHVMTAHGECCTSTIRAIPNPLVWWSGLASIPALAWLAWRERNKGYALLVVAYFFQWLPWIRSPRLAFEYHFYPNLAIIILANTVVLQHLWNIGRERGDMRGRYAVAAYAVAVVAAFVYFFPLVSGWPITTDAFNARIWNQHWI
ncbi:MAG: dolichyl-phosphate-mannose-protein mannosyltransferase [Candidatus Eremiobacteraeota bacterium]|nr:dolichyl-phosphate-mannose-protein mannosyltransferase [Candidatus Eremiobacteraeota bacterium]